MENRREFYRLDLFGEVEVIITNSSGKEKGKLQDVSVTGASFESEYDFDFKTAFVTFHLDKVEFSRTAELIRKKNLKSGKTFFAIRFVNFTEPERKLLFQTLLRLDAKKRLGGGK